MSDDGPRTRMIIPLGASGDLSSCDGRRHSPDMGTREATLPRAGLEEGMVFWN